jgi:FlaA1/EpsC-like NDP-sugar epimerase
MGSVVPIFREQISRGGPVTVTDPEMRRYFMTIPEAAQLVLQAGALAHGGEIFVLDMGEPILIADLARDMIRMCGLRPEIDIPIVFTGRRPGEKLFEELLFAKETHDRTVHSKILVGKASASTLAEMHLEMARLSESLNGRPEVLIRMIASLVPEARLDAMPSAPMEAEAQRVLSGLDHLSTMTVPETS